MYSFAERRRQVSIRRDKEMFDFFDDLPNAQDNQVLSMCFIPNPKTGRPDGTLSLMLSEKERPQVREFIRDNLFTSLQRSGFDDPDDAIAMCDDPHNQIGNECDSFRERVVEFVNSLRGNKGN